MKPQIATQIFRLPGAQLQSKGESIPRIDAKLLNRELTRMNADKEQFCGDRPVIATPEGLWSLPDCTSVRESYVSRAVVSQSCLILSKRLGIVFLSEPR